MREHIFTAEMIKAADAAAPRYGVEVETLMDNAAAALYREIGEVKGRTLILCGNGNNGGDGYALYGLMLKDGRDADCIRVCEGDMSPLCEKKLGDLPENSVSNMWDDPAKALAAVEEAEVIIDCIFGTGFKGTVPAELKELFGALAGKNVIACDLPSGVVCDRGIPAKLAVCAKKTVTFAFYKPCFYMFPSRDNCGEIVLADIGMPSEAVEEQAPYIEFLTAKKVRSLIRPRAVGGHKGTFGSVQLVCGSDLMTGAAALSCKGALKSGVGLVYLSLPERARTVLQSTLYEPVYTMPDAMAEVTAQVVGPGLGPRAERVWGHLCRSVSTVVDADGINLMAKKLAEGKSLPMRNMLLTPHPAEFGRLVGKRAKEVEDDRFNLVREFAMKKHCVVLLKGKYTLIALPDGHIYMNTTGNTGLAKGGSGDVLAGFAGGLLAQGYTTEEAALISAYLHGKAADTLVSEGREESEIQPTDIVDYIGRKEYLLGSL